MNSLFCAIGTYGFVSSWIAYQKKKEGKERYGEVGCVLAYLLTRVFVCIQFTHLEIAFWQNCLMDAGIFLSLYLLTKKDVLEFRWEYVWLYVSNPVVLLSLSSTKKILAVAIGVFIIIAIMKRAGISCWQEHMMMLYRYYILFTGCGMLYLAARMLFNQSAKQLVWNDGVYPAVWVLAVLFTAITIAQFIREFCKCNENKLKLKGGDTAKEIAVVGLMTVIYAVIVICKLGSTEAPQTFMRFANESGQNQLVFQFEEDVKISQIDIFLGVKERRKITFSSYNLIISDWEEFDSEKQIVSVLEWNTVPVDETVRALRFSLLDEETYIHEIAFLDTKGNAVLPENWLDYERLFDEQEFHPQYPTYYHGTMFDEIYYARTAYEFMNGLTPYEITHPPLGKLLMCLGITVFGLTPFGWRIVCAVFGIAMVPLMYIFARKLFGKGNVALCTTGIFCFEFMHLTLSRIATLDIIIAFFVLGMFCFMYMSIAELRKNGFHVRAAGYLLLCGSFSACAVATKWTGFYALAGIAVLFLGYFFSEYHSKEKILGNLKSILPLAGVCVLAFVVLPVCVYFLSYIPYTWSENEKNFVEITIGNFQYMINYHKDKVFNHPYSSEWYEWIWMKRPLLDAVDRTSAHSYSTVATFGNPVVWWGGIAALLHNIYLWRCKQEKRAAYLCIAYLAMLIPWLFICRTVFIYQYFICSNILVLLIGNSFYSMGKRGRKGMVLFTLAAGVLFICFYPVLTGCPAEREYIDGLEWLKSWAFV